MQTATVVYVTATSQIPESYDLEVALEERGFDSRWTALAGSQPGMPSVPDAILVLAARGASRIEATWARLTEQGALDVTARRLRLRG